MSLTLSGIEARHLDPVNSLEVMLASVRDLPPPAQDPIRASAEFSYVVLYFPFVPSSH